MNRVFVPPDAFLRSSFGTLPGSAPRLRVEGDLFHYLVKVLRLRPGDRFAAAAEGGPDRLCVIEEVDKRWLEARVEGERPPASEAPVKVNLYQGWPKGDKLELIIQKATELGAVAITPVLTERSVPRPAGQGRIADKLARWQAVAREASEQCGRAVIPAVSEPLTLPAAAAAMTVRGRPAFVLWEGEKTTGFLEALGKLGIPEGSRSPAARCAGAEVALMVGPEGGLSPAEVSALVAAGVTPVSLGPRILRTETAAITAVAIVLERLGDLGRAFTPRD